MSIINWIFHLINHFGYLAVILLLTLECVFPPIPSEVVLAFSGFLSHSSSLKVPLLIVASTIGSLIGALILFYIGRILSQERLMSLLQHNLFKKLGFKPNDVIKAINWFNRFGTKSVFFGRFIPIVRSLISIPAGIAKIDLFSFIIYTTLGSLIWNSVIITLGYFMGSNWQLIVLVFEDYSLIVLAIALLFMMYGLVWWYKKRIKR